MDKLTWECQQCYKLVQFPKSTGTPRPPGGLQGGKCPRAVDSKNEHLWRLK
jgi:hypothetical protein